MAIGGVACLLIYVLPAAYIDDHGGRLTLSLIGQSWVIYCVFQSTVVSESGLPVNHVKCLAYSSRGLHYFHGTVGYLHR